jgi:aspartate aminotransferase
MAIRQSATLAVNERLRARRAAGEPVLHLAFGEAGLPVLPQLGDVLANSLRHNDYSPVAGTPSARDAAAGYFSRRNLPTEPGQIVLAPGSKPLLFALLAVLPGDLVLPVPSWLSYSAQAALVGKAVIGVPIAERAGGAPDPARLEQALADARADGRRPGVLLLTVPDNPTGTLAPPDVLAEVCRIAEREGLVVISDEIYRDLCRAPADYLSPAELLPERTIVTGGLSKNLALGGYRIGFTRLPAELMAGETGSDLFALAEPPEVTERIAASRRLHAALTDEVYRIFLGAGATCRPPEAAFYLYPGFAGMRDTIGVHTGRELAELLLDRYGVGVLAGEDFGDDPHSLRLRVATSLLYGETDEQRLAALNSPEPLALPWIADSLATLTDALADLTGVGQPSRVDTRSAVAMTSGAQPTS